MESFLFEYAVYLARERELVSATIQREKELIRPFLAGRIRDEHLDLEPLTAAKRDCVHPGLQAERRTGDDATHGYGAAIAAAIPAPARSNLLLAGRRRAHGRRQEAVRLPKYLTGAQVTRLLTSCDLATPVGRRDQAILLMPVRLGLRAREVAACTWTTSTGGGARSRCTARETGTTVCRSRSMSERRWRTT
ncbi:hypothetical protein ACIBO2_28945 [Nonomuraea sp. NPDC050022]|uniref:hypothetical protein n=1 Tax=unclassified Nonomuraea TaxID=2593643 RepID=UPI0033CBA3B9